MEFFDLVKSLIGHLPIRTQDIISKRYGLPGEEGWTLEHIGQEYGITRERIRQIIADAIKSIINLGDAADFKKAEELLIFTIERNNGIIKENKIVETFNQDGPRESNAVKFFAGCSKKIKTLGEKGMIEDSWVLSEKVSIRVKEVVAEAENILRKEKRILNDKEMAGKISLVFPELSEDQLLSFLSVSVRVKKNKFGKWGIYNWAEINPKGAREKIYLVLKEKKQPLHFTEIAKLIDSYKLGKKKAHPQTVHNELIKDSRFVLIGRGIYALAQWGYQEGTIKDVITNILEKSEKPLDKEEILKEVFRVRKVKKATIMINLNNSRIFEKHKDSYSIKR